MPPEPFPTPIPHFFLDSVDGIHMEHPFALRDSEFGQIVPEHGLDADRELLLGQQRALGHAEHEFRSHLLRGTDQLRCAATEQAILRKFSENRAPIGPLRHPNEGWELRLHQRHRGVFTPAARPPRPPLSERAADPGVMHAVRPAQNRACIPAWPG